MLLSKGVSLKKISSITISLITIGGFAFAGSATAADLYTASAPITYKMDNPHAYSVLPQQPVMQQPVLQQPQIQHMQAAPLTLAAPTQFDPRRVNPNLHTHQRVGNPYTIFGKTYTPAHNPTYDMSGIASWYGDKFHGKPTASGEIYNKRDMTVAHPTLPLNSLVHVTNLDNGRTAILRVNDRGPFKDNRLIDLSEASAEYLGTKTMGLARVRVQYAGPSQPVGSAPHAPAPQVAQNYQPLRQMAPAPVMPAPQMPAPQMSAPQMPAPQPQTVAELPSVNVPSIMMPTPFLPQTQPLLPIPEASAGQIQDDVETLTIKGPIHMAVARTTREKVKVTAAVYKTAK